ncbi:STAS domain-containing protein [Pseudoalteromonas denitrificans]|uniref:Phospholipid transport system transporter-binding protein n=1 Tax=Pseudoalteromonas denitrificans DSM 6059 TaxID=1123010 RepID=A0A1I1R855_9GAMM|nr:STAS domain-containing protein [Pseudoalteromonas denitrificans]SFD30495.1 phospholipid transport system transporter-binding protein [Pseudoalteromonas denitrificans DSM 6059]
MSKLNLIHESKNNFNLSGELSRDTVIAYSNIKKIASKGDDCINFNLSGVLRVDTAGLAWLIHILSELRQQGIRLELNNIPVQLQKLMQLGQVSHLFE